MPAHPDPLRSCVVYFAYDEASNITSVTDHVRWNAGNQRKFDAMYTLDNLYRLTGADEGTLSAGSISNRRVNESWTLTQTGNFDLNQCDLNGDSDFADAGDVDDDRAHSNVNEIKTWRPAGSGGSTYTVTHDKCGNMTSDGQYYEFVYDVFGRLKSIDFIGGLGAVAEYTYNGLGYRTGWHYDVDFDGVVESPGVNGDSWFYFAYDERWRLVATYRDTDANANAKEHSYYHAAGLAGYGFSSYIDSVVWRDKDANTGWNSAADSTLDQRRYFCQNWRADVSVVLTDTGTQVETIKYSAYGVPICIPAGDVDQSGTTDGADAAAVGSWGSYKTRADVDLDGDVDSTDTAAVTTLNGTTGGRGVLSRSDTGNRKGYAGYESDATADAGGSRFWHVRHRVLDSTLGRWTRRDPLGYVADINLFAYVSARVLVTTDPSGLDPCAAERANVQAQIRLYEAAVLAGAVACAAAVLLPSPITIAACVTATITVVAQAEAVRAASMALQVCLTNNAPRQPELPKPEPAPRDPRRPVNPCLSNLDKSSCLDHPDCGKCCVAQVIDNIGWCDRCAGRKGRQHWDGCFEAADKWFELCLSRCRALKAEY